MTRRLVPALVLLAACAGDQKPAATEPDASEGHDSSAPIDSGAPPAEPLALPSLPEAPDLDPAPGRVEVHLRAHAQSYAVPDPAGGEALLVEGYAYSGGVPGPTIRAQVGDTVVVQLQNDLPVPTTIHWHGIDVPYAMDGVVSGAHGHGGDSGLPDPLPPGLVPPGGSFRYEFVVDRPLTAWYHPHFDSDRQVDLGLYGALVVEDPAEPRLEVERVLVLDDLNPEALSAAEGHTGGHAGAHAAHGEGLWLVNGVPAPWLAVEAGQRLRLRFINASNVGTVVLARDDGEALRVIARDQGALPAVEAVATELLAPGDRVELELLPGPEGIRLIDLPWVHEGGAALGEPAPLLELRASGGAPPAAPAFAGEAVAPSPDPGRTDVRWLLQGSFSGDDWRINGEVFPEVTPAQGWVGAPLVIEVQNLSPTEHPFHLHGMAFEVLSIDGAPPAQRQVEDTINLGLYQRARLLATPPAAGDWMAHCHILPHADGGMMTLLRVEEAP